MTEKLQYYPLTKLKAGSTTDHILPSYFPQSSETVHARLQKQYHNLYNATIDMQLYISVLTSMADKETTY